MGATFDRKLLMNGLTIIICIDLLWNLVTSFSSSMPFVPPLNFCYHEPGMCLCFYFLFATFFKETKAIRTFIWLLGISVCLLATYTIFEHSKGSFTRGFAYAAMQPFLPDHGMYAALVAFFDSRHFLYLPFGDSISNNPFLRG